MTAFFYACGDFFQAIFRYMPKLGNIPNITMIIIGFAAFSLWVRRMARYNKEAEEQGTLK